MPINSSSIPALRIAREVRRKRRAEGGAVAYDPMSGLQIGGDSSEAAAPDPQGPLSKIASRLTGTQFGEPRYQLWPEKMVRSGFTLPHDVGTGEVPMHVMDQTTGEMVLNPDMIQRAQDMAGMAGGQTLLTGAREAVPAAQRALVAAADSSATGAPVAALERAHQGYNIDAYKGMSPYHPDSLPETNWKGDPVHGTDDRVPREITEGQGGRFYSDDPAVASRFAEALSKEGAVFPSKLKMENPVVIDAQGAPAAALQFESIARKYNMLPEYEQFKAAREFKGDHDGVVVKNTADEGTIYMPRSGEQVRSRFAQFDPRNAGKNGLLLSDSAGPGAPLASLEHAPAFYSGLERTVEAIPQPTMTGKQWLGTLNNKGVKAEEMQWSGLGDYLTAKADQPVSKAEVAEHLGANQVKLGDVHKGAPKSWEELSGPEQWKLVDRWGVAPNRAREMYEEYRATGEDVSDFGVSSDATKYHDLQLPGGENYREKLLTLPAKGISPEELIKRDGSLNMGNKGELAPTYSSSHWEEPNVLVHRRTNERPYDIPFSPEEQAAAEAHQAARPQIEALRQQQSAVGRQIVEASGPLNAARSDELMAKARAKKMTAGEYNRALEQGFDHPELKPLQDKLQALRAQENQIRAGLPPEPKPKQGRALHIEEIQSDWHQAGRKRGYQTAVPEPKGEVIHDPSGDAKFPWRIMVDGKEWNRTSGTRERALAELDDGIEAARKRAQRDAVPDAPFKKNWHELALKDAIREAAEKGLDRVSWTPGEAQAARYDLSKQVEAVRANKNPDGTYQIGVKPHGRNMVPHDTSVPQNKLADVVGKELAEKIVSEVTEPGVESGKVFSGIDLKVGGEGMKGFYDKIIPDYLNKIGKPHGAKVQSGETGAGVDNFDIEHTGSGWRVVDKTQNQGQGTFVGPVHRSGADAEKWLRDTGRANAPVHYMDIPPSLKEQALKKGFSLFEDSATPGAAVSAAEAAAKERALVDELWHGISNVRLPKPIREMSSSHQPIKGQQARERVMRPSDMQGGLLYPLVGDRTVAGSRLKRVNGFKFSDPVEMQGGHGFMAANADTGAAWASGQGVVKRLSNAVRNLAKGEKPVYGVYTAMGERSADFSHHVSDTLTEMLKHTKVARDGKAAFDEAMRGQAKGFDAAADWPGVGSKKLREYLANAPGAVRNKFAKLMDTRKFQDFGFPSVAEARHAVTDPRLLNEPTGASGLSISRLDPAGRMFKSASQHRSYDTNLGGQYAGGLGMSVPKEVMYPEIVSSLEGYRDKLPGYKPTIDYLMTRTPTGQPTVQHATQQWVDNISKYLQDRGVPGMKAGGSVDAAMDVARCIKRAKGGKVHVGPILGDTDGRADEVPMEVPDGAYVLTADHCSSMGEGNTLSGFKKLNEMFPKSAQARTAKKEPIKRAAGGKVPIYAADGEYVICPEDIVERWGDLDRGHRILDAWQTAERKEHVKTLKGLAPPAQD